MADTFPRQYARTRRFTLGEPRGFRVSPDDCRVVFLRSRGGSDPVTCLWVLDLPAPNAPAPGVPGPSTSAAPDPGAPGEGPAEGAATPGSGRAPHPTERLVADPLALFTLDAALPEAEKAQRERLRESAEGITSFAADKELTLACFTVQGRLFITDLRDPGAAPRSIPPNGVFDPRLSPDGSFIAYLAGRSVRVCAADGSDDRQLAGEDDEQITWGQADFVAAEELDRYRGYWWSPDSTRLLAARVDTTAVQQWHISDPAHPERTPAVHRYPAAGTPNAIVTLAILGLDGSRTPVAWDSTALPYLVDAYWTDTALHLLLMNRAQTAQQLVRVDPATGASTTVSETHSDVWVEKAPGTPAWLADGRLVGVAPSDDDFALFFGAERMTTAAVQVRRVAHVGDDYAIICVNDATTWEQSAVVVPASQSAAGAPSAARAHSVEGAPTVTRAQKLATGGGVDVVVGRDVAVVRSSTMQRTSTNVVRWRTGEVVAEIASHAETPLVDPKPSFMLVHDRIPVAVLLPAGAAGRDPSTKLPVLMNPYGGPHAQMVMATRGAHLTSQWLADQGFAVVVVDGRGTPGRGVSWEHAVHNDLAGPVLDDQVEGLLGAAERYPQLDLTRVGIRGWSFGGYLAALAVLRRPDIFHAAIAGAPVTEWRLYDTGYTERYLGDPSTNGVAYDSSSLLVDAYRLERPLMLVHGLADDNVVVAHTLQFSSALLAAGKPHEVLPLSGVTHMTPQEVVAENLLLLQVEFLKRQLRV